MLIPGRLEQVTAQLGGGLYYVHPQYGRRGRAHCAPIDPFHSGTEPLE